MQQGLDFQNKLDIRPSIKPLLGIRPFGPDRLELAFPIAQYMGCNVGDFAYFSNLKIEFIRYFRLHIGNLLL